MSPSLRRTGAPAWLCGLALLVCTGSGTRVGAAETTHWVGGGPDLAWVTHLARPFGPDGALYAGTFGGGLWSSDDGGGHWTEATSNAPDVTVRDIELGVDVQRSLYLATDERGVLRAPGGSLFFTEVNTGLNAVFLPRIDAIEIHPDQPLRISAGTSGGVFTSRDRGNSWPDSLAWLIGNIVVDLEVSPSEPGTLHALTADALYRSADFGQTRQRFDAGLPLQHALSGAEFWPGSAESLVVSDLAGHLHLFDGARFVPLDPPFGPDAPRFYGVEVVEGDAPALYAYSDRGVHCLHQRLQLWRFLDGGLDFPEVWAIEVEDAIVGDFWAGTFTRGLVRVRGETDWTPSNEGLRAAWVRSVAFDGDALLVGTAHGRLFRSADEGLSWQDVTGDLSTLQILAVSVTSDGAYLASGFDGLRRSEDGGGHWMPVALPDGVVRSHRFVQPSWTAPGTIFAATDRGLLVSEDFGRSWARPSSASLPIDLPCFALAVADTAPRLALAFDPVGGATRARLFEGRWPDGLSEVAVPPGFSARARGLAYGDPAGRRLVFAGLPAGGTPLYLFDTVAGTFEDLSPGLPLDVLYATDLQSLPGSGQLVLATDLDGVFHSSDRGVSWTPWSEGLYSKRTEELALQRGSTPRVLVGTLARGAYVRALPQSVAVAVAGPWIESLGDGRLRVRFEIAGEAPVRVWRRDDAGRRRLWSGTARGRVEVFDTLSALRGESIVWGLDLRRDGVAWTEAASARRDRADLVPRTTRLLGAAPNPFNPRTTIRWEQERRATTQLEVFDLRGRLLRRLVNESVGAGPHQVVFDGQDDRGASLASGNYFVRLRVDGRSWTSRITLVR